MSESLIKLQVEKEIANTFKKEEYKGVLLSENNSRYYPYNNLASHLIGFTGTDNNGLFGLENSLDSILAGTVGKVVALTDSVNGEIPNQHPEYSLSDYNPHPLFQR